MDNNELLNSILEQQKNFQEEMRSEFQSVNERFAGIDARFNEMDERFAGIDERFNEMDERFDALNKNFIDIDKKVNKVDNEVGLLTSQTTAAINSLSEKMDFMNTKLDDHIVARYEVDFVLEKVQHLEKEIFKLKQ